MRRTTVSQFLERGAIDIHLLCFDIEQVIKKRSASASTKGNDIIGNPLSLKRKRAPRPEAREK